MSSIEPSVSLSESCTAPGAAAPFVALSRFVVANGMTEAVKQAFRDRPRLVDGEPGFLGLQVLSPREHPDEIWLLTVWDAEASFRRWHHSHAHRASHAGIPKGLKLDPKGTRLQFFDQVAT